MKVDNNMATDAKRIKDHNLNDDDVKEIKDSKLSKMDQFERFQYKFPFYRMDVNGYIMHIKEAMKLYKPDSILMQIHEVDLPSLQSAFKSFQSWGDLNDENSQFVQFLNDNMSDNHDFIFDVRKIKCLGVQWCDGSNKERVQEFYDIVQDNQQPCIVANDKDTRKNLLELFNISTKLVFDNIKKYGGNENCVKIQYT